MSWFEWKMVNGILVENPPTSEKQEEGERPKNINKKELRYNCPHCGAANSFIYDHSICSEETFNGGLLSYFTLCTSGDHPCLIYIDRKGKIRGAEKILAYNPKFISRKLENSQKNDFSLA